MLLMRELTRVSNLALDAVNVTAVHLRCIAGLVSTLVTRTTREVEDLRWDYHHLAGEMRDGLVDRGLDNVIPLDSRRRAAGYP